MDMHKVYFQTMLECCKVRNPFGVESGAAVNMTQLILLMCVLKEEFARGEIPQCLHLLFSLDGTRLDNKSVLVGTLGFANLGIPV